MGRRFTGQRELRVLIRTAHIAGAAMMLDPRGLSADAGLGPALTVGAGALLIADDLYRHGPAWLRYLQAWVIIGKLALLVVAALWFPEHLGAAAWAALLLGGLISHASGAVRHLALWGTAGPCAGSGECSKKNEGTS